MVVTFGDFVRQKRKERNISVRIFAELIGKSYSYVSQIEQGARPAPRENVCSNMVNILRLSAKDKEIFYDLAAQTKGRVADDLADYINTTPAAIQTLRLAKKYNADEKEWSSFAKEIKEKNVEI